LRRFAIIAVAAQLLTLGLPAAALAQQRITVQPPRAARGDTIMVEGFGWSPGDPVDVSLLSAFTSANPDQNGHFSIDLVVPDNAPIGPTTVDADDGTRTAQAPFEVTPSPNAVALGSAGSAGHDHHGFV
jgi:hypothetical protein